jgi:hypothetical protein
MQRTLLSWAFVFGLLVAGFAATVAAVNNDVLSVHGFVRSYLDVLERHDATEALAMLGVTIEGDPSLAVDEAVGDFSDIRFLSDTADGDTHTVRFSYLLGGERHFTDFTVERTGTRLLLFSDWEFAESPVATLNASADHDSALTVNGVAVAAGEYPVLVPGLYVADDDTEFFAGAEDAAAVTAVADTVTATVKVTATSAFDQAAQKAVDTFLDGCATQTVLMPTGCPFGRTVNNRLDGVPAWSISSYPEISLTPEADAGVWRARASGGSADIAVKVQSLFDGSVSTLNDTVALTADYIVTIGVDGTLRVELR